MNKKKKMARLSIISNTVLTTGKLIAGFSMGSMAVISEGFHSGMDLMAACIAFFSISKASEPADEEHKFGHGKYENVASIIEALLIVGAAGLIIWKAFPKLFDPTPVHSLGIGIIVMAISAGVNLIVSRLLLKTAKEYDSPALAADGWHLLTDVYTSAGVLIGIAIIKLTGWYVVDPIIAICVSFLILKAAYDLIRDSMKSILDESLPDEEENTVVEILREYEHKYVEFHELRTRKAGAERHIDLHLVTAHHLPIGKVHEVCEEIESRIKEFFPECTVLIHAEPCDGSCNICYEKKECTNCAYEEE